MNNNNNNNMEIKIVEKEVEKSKNVLTTIRRMYKEQNDILSDERKQAKETFQLLKDQWVQDVKDLESDVDGLKRQLIQEDLMLKLEKRKSALFLSMKQRQNCLLRLKLEYAESDVEDFREFVDYLVRQLSAEREKSGGKGKEGEEDNEPNVVTTMEEGSPSLILASEVEKFYKDKEDDEANVGTVMEEGSPSLILASEVEKRTRGKKILTSRNESEVSELLSDVGIAYNRVQNIRTNDISFQMTKCSEAEPEMLDELLASMEQLISSNTENDKKILKLEADISLKRAEVEQANEKLEILRTDMEKLQSSLSEKDETIAKLKGDLSFLNHKCDEVEKANEKLVKLLTSMEQLESSISAKDATILQLKDDVNIQTSKRVEVEQANDKLLTSMEQLQSSITEKDALIVELKAELAKFEEETNKSKREPSKLSEEVEILRKSGGASFISVVKCTKPHTRGMEKQKRGTEKPNISRYSKLCKDKEVKTFDCVSLVPVVESCTTRVYNTRSKSRQKMNMERPEPSQVLKKPEMKESRTRKRKQDENTSSPDPSTRKKRAA